MSYAELFQALTGFKPHPYQERIQEQLCAGDSVILRVPTGAGKTWAAVAPFIYSQTGGRPFADRLLYALPLRSLASSLHTSVYSRIGDVVGELAAVANDRTYAERPYYCTLQMGGQKDDVFFRGDVVFTTIDQLLSSYVFLPVALPDRVGNVNAGSLIGSLVVFDEIHLLDASVALGTVIEMLDRLSGLCQFVLMTATTSDKAIAWLAERLGAICVPVTDGEVRALPSQRTKHRTWRWRNDRIDAPGIAGQHKSGRTIVLLNSVQRAQDLFVDLERLYAGDSNKPHLLLLHARFYPEDRRLIEDQLPGYFGPHATKTNAILVTTQVIEAGMDLSADDLHTEAAPMNALIQRAGRTARYEDRAIGTVTVYGGAGAGPYAEEKPLLEATRDVLTRLPEGGCAVDFAQERAWVEAVHATAEESALERFRNLHERRQDVHKAMDQGDRGRLRALVRDIDSVAVAITAKPEKLFEHHGWPRLLSVSGYSLRMLGRRFQEVTPGRWVAKGAIERETDERPGSAIEWQILSEGQLAAQWLVAIHPDYATYDSRLGLRLGEGGPPPRLTFSDRPPGQQYNYEFESWEEHAERILAQARATRRLRTRGAAALAKRYEVPEEWIEQLVEMACAFHDTGKLAVDWQSRAWLWQNDKDLRARSSCAMRAVRPSVAIAHTEFDPAIDHPFKRQAKYTFPPHAVQGAFAVANAVAARLATMGGEAWGNLAATCVVTAIARHHGPRTHECTMFRLSPGATRAVATVLPAAWAQLELDECSDAISRDQFREVLLTFSREDDEAAWPLYSFLVRQLRLADQAASAR